MIFKLTGEEGRIRGIFLVILRRKFFQGWGGERTGPTLPPLDPHMNIMGNCEGEQLFQHTCLFV